MDTIDSPHALRDLYGTVSPLAERKVLPSLDEHCRAFINLSPLVVIATADASGGMDASPRGDAAGFVLVVDDNHLLLPDRPGNNRVDSYGNIVVSPAVGLLFFVPGLDETLRVNGKAAVITDADRLAKVAAHGKTPKAGLLIAVEEAFFHCGKALKRSRFWNSEGHIARDAFPSLGKIIADQTGQCSVAEADARIASDYVNKLY
jgi:PPOX class probable FMN-dependent enzyme